MYADLETDALTELVAQLEREHAAIKARELSLNMARDKPAADQLELSMPLLSTVSDLESCTAESGLDCRNYGVLDGLPEAKRLMAVLLDDANGLCTPPLPLNTEISSRSHNNPVSVGSHPHPLSAIGPAFSCSFQRDSQFLKLPVRS